MLHQEHHTLHNSNTENHNMPESPLPREPKKIAPRLDPAAPSQHWQPVPAGAQSRREKEKSEAPKPIPSQQAPT